MDYKVKFSGEGGFIEPCQQTPTPGTRVLGRRQHLVRYATEDDDDKEDENENEDDKEDEDE